VNDAGVGWNHLEIVERALSPAQERIPLTVAGELQLRIERKRVGATEVVDLDRVVDDQLDGLQRVDAVGIPSERNDRVAHRSEIDDAGDAGEVLQEDARRHERDFLVRRGRRIPVRQRGDVVCFDEGVVFAAQQVLEQDLHRVRQSRHAVEAGFGKRLKAVDLNRLSANADVGARSE
jgi:hypothetical protein